jgi:hypothetical protein
MNNKKKKTIDKGIEYLNYLNKESALMEVKSVLFKHGVTVIFSNSWNSHKNILHTKQ